jgi:putative ABC transport system permease protein
MAMAISLLGLFGLSSFSVERRTKEIGLRKILGANNRTILALVSKNFMWLLTISFVLAVPLGYYFMNAWLSSFAFKASISPWLFLLAGAGNIALGLAILLYHSLRIAETNPVDTLRYE